MSRLSEDYTIVAKDPITKQEKSLVELFDLEEEEIEYEEPTPTRTREQIPHDLFEGVVASKWDLTPVASHFRDKILPNVLTDDEFDTCQEIIRILHRESNVGIIPLDKNSIGLYGINRDKIWRAVFWRSKMVDVFMLVLTVSLCLIMFDFYY